MATERTFRSFEEFYPFYLSEHSNPACRRLHFVGTTFVILIVAYAIVTVSWPALVVAPLVGYGFAWVGHFFFEKNKPATFRNPIYSFLSDWVMYKQILKGEIRF